MGCKYFLPACHVSFVFAYCSRCHVELVLNLGRSQSVSLSLCSLWDFYRVLKNLPHPRVIEAFPYMALRLFSSFTSMPLIHLEFVVICAMRKDLFSFPKSSQLTQPNYWKCTLSSLIFKFHFYGRLNSPIYLRLFLGSQIQGFSNILRITWWVFLNSHT